MPSAPTRAPSRACRRAVRPRRARPLVVDDARRDDRRSPRSRPCRAPRRRCRSASRRAPWSRRARATACRRTSSGVPPCSACTCSSTSPGITHMPVASISLVDVARRPVGLHRQPGRAGRADLRDPVALDDDVARALHRAARPVDDVHAADDELGERALPFVRPTRRRDGLRAGRNRHGARDDERGGDRARTEPHDSPLFLDPLFGCLSDATLPKLCQGCASLFGHARLPCRHT